MPSLIQQAVCIGVIVRGGIYISLEIVTHYAPGETFQEKCIINDTKSPFFCLKCVHSTYIILKLLGPFFRSYTGLKIMPKPH